MASGLLAELGIDLDAVEEALDRNYTFPARWYSDPRIYEFELERIFTRSWQIAVPLHKVERPGSFAVARVAHIPVVVVRGADGELRGFVNVCRHRAYPVAAEDGCRKTLQCAYHGWTYELDGRLRQAPRSEREPDFDPAEFSLVPVSVDTWCGYAWVNPDPEAPPFREVHPDAEPLALERGLDFSGYRYYGSYQYEIEANWKVWVENATECYHCPTVHKGSFSDAFDVDVDVYEYRNVGRILGQFTRYNPRARAFPVNGERTPNDFRFIYVWPTSFFAMDDFVAFPGIIVPTGPESCHFVAEMYVHPDLGEQAMEDWVEMYNRTLSEDADAVRVQQPGLRSRMVPNGRLMPGSESSISSFHRMVFDAFAEALP
jgi:phenylpropionate dioxygenase-like ring-hydroxylating dioxygenase large terminal subunit